MATFVEEEKREAPSLTLKRIGAIKSHRWDSFCSCLLFVSCMQLHKGHAPRSIGVRRGSERNRERRGEEGERCEQVLDTILAKEHSTFLQV